MNEQYNNTHAPIDACNVSKHKKRAYGKLYSAYRALHALLRQHGNLFTDPAEEFRVAQGPLPKSGRPWRVKQD